MHFRIRTKLFGLGLAGVALSVILGSTGWVSVRRVGEATESVRVTGAAIRHHMECDMMHDALRGDVLASFLAASDAERQQVRSDLKDHAEHFHRQLAENEKLKLDGEVVRAIVDLRPVLDGYIAQAEKVVASGLADATKGREGLPEFLKSFSVLEDRMASLSDIFERSANDAETRSVEVEHAASLLILIAVAVGGVALGVIAFVISSSITRPLGQVTAQMKEIAQGEGDLTRRLALNREDEVGELSRWFDTFMENLHRMMTDLQRVSGTVGSAVQELSGATERISDGAQRQAAGLEETGASLERLTETVRQNADSAQQANRLADGARSVAETGGNVVGRAVSAMTEINKSSRKIADIITTIDEIAFQTNLLALNAAVEAARAGEQGRGFAVVAAEVRNLAQRSASSAREIKNLIQDSVRKIDAGSELVNQSGTTLQEIVGAVKRVTDIVAEIAAASREQSTGIEQINRAVGEIDQVTQRSAGESVEISDTAKKLSSQASELEETVGRFRI